MNLLLLLAPLLFHTTGDDYIKYYSKTGDFSFSINKNMEMEVEVEPDSAGYSETFYVLDPEDTGLTLYMVTVTKVADAVDEDFTSADVRSEEFKEGVLEGCACEIAGGKEEYMFLSEDGVTFKMLFSNGEVALTFYTIENGNVYAVTFQAGSDELLEYYRSEFTALMDSLEIYK